FSAWASANLFAQIGNWYTSLLAGLAIPHVHRTILQRLLADGDANRTADQVGVRELLSGPKVAVVEEHVEPCGREARRRLLRLPLRVPERHHVHVVRRHRAGPDDPLFVVALLDHRRHHPAGADPVAAADQRLLGPVLVEERRAERRAVLVAEVEDVAHLDRRLEGERAAALRAAVALARLPQVGEAGLVVAAGPNAAQMEAVAVGAGDELALAQRLVGDHLAVESDRTERAAARAERRPDLVVARGPDPDLQRGEELRV